MKLKKCAGLFSGAFFLLFFLLPGAGAANRPSALTLSPIIGAHLFSNDQHLDAAPLYGLGIGYNLTDRLGTEAIFSYVPTQTKSGTKDDVRYTSLRLDLLYHFPASRSLLPYLAVGAGGAIVAPEKVASDTNFLLGYGGGVKYFINDTLALRCDVRHLVDINDADAQRRHTAVSNFAANAGLLLQFGGVKTVVPPRDSDGDKIVDTLDRCPDTPPGTVVDDSGCPLPKIGDSDGDGVNDNRDRCPGTAAGVVVDGKGCPIVTDKDHDGVVDEQDACPDTPEKVKVDNRGCPELPEPVMTFYLEYLPNEAEIRAEFAGEMEKMAAFVKANPGHRFVIEGHTDSVGNDAANMKLSLQRAEKIAAYLSGKMGISPALLEARGFGESNPIADNNTQEGRSQNRRVVIVALPQ